MREDQTSKEAEERERLRCKRIAQDLEAVAKMFWTAHYTPQEMTAEKWQRGRPVINTVIRALVEEFV